jgi:purine nucleosidase
MEKIPVLLDTDIGSDIDDAVALAYLLKQPRCDLLGITTVTGEPDRRAMLADAVCRAAGRADVPIHVGTEPPLLILPRQPQAPQAEALTDRWPHRTFSRENTAIAFLREAIHARPGEITLLTVGPLTNIALLFTLDPEIPALLKQLVMMGGRYYSRSPQGAVLEWNVLCDPHAAAKVFAAPVPSLLAVGLDVTEKCRMEAETCRARFAAAGGPLAPVAAMAEVWFKHASAITFHDPLAATLIFEPALCRVESTRIEVDLVSPRALGQTLHVHDAGERSHQVAVSVDADAFFRHYFAVVGG